MGRYLEFIKTYRLLHRDSQKRIYFKDVCYFITCKTEGNVSFFRERIFADLFVENLRLCKRLKGFFLFGWVLVYDHFHLLVQPDDEFNISEVMFSIKKQFSHNINIIFDFNKPYIPHEGAQSIARLREKWGNKKYENGSLIKITKQFDRYIQKLKNRFHQKYPTDHPFPPFQWQKSFHDHIIRNDHDFDYHMEYIQYNPVKHGLPNGWPYVFTNPEYEDLLEEN
ncbi:transposase [Candidatus Peregrinibacteria bacterium]|nr:transposase [Candidatus Peregrinibacteria bacterium]